MKAKQFLLQLTQPSHINLIWGLSGILIAVMPWGLL